MVEIYSSLDKLLVYHIKNLLENHGIECVIKNEHLSMASIDVIPGNYPAVWIIDDQKLSEAKEILATVFDENCKNKENRSCPGCSEVIEPQFSECWKCGYNFKN